VIVEMRQKEELEKRGLSEKDMHRPGTAEVRLFKASEFANPPILNKWPKEELEQRGLLEKDEHRLEPAGVGLVKVLEVLNPRRAAEGGPGEAWRARKGQAPPGVGRGEVTAHCSRFLPADMPLSTFSLLPSDPAFKSRLQDGSCLPRDKESRREVVLVPQRAALALFLLGRATSAIMVLWFHRRRRRCTRSASGRRRQRAGTRSTSALSTCCTHSFALWSHPSVFFAQTAEALYEKRKKKTAPEGWDAFNQRTLYDAYERRTAAVNVDLQVSIFLPGCKQAAGQGPAPWHSMAC